MEALAKKPLVRLKDAARDLCPPLVWRGLQRAKAAVRASAVAHGHGGHPSTQDLDVYWDDEMAALLDTWGEGNVWNEIQLLLHDARGRVLDIACGTGKTMEVLSRFPALELTGCDISDRLIAKARERGIAPERLRVADATRLDYPDGNFSYSYSIGSFEHFTEEGIRAVIAESSRVTTLASFHMVPVSRSGRDEGWMKTYQSFFNNSIPWWLNKYGASYARVEVLPSAWEDSLSVGRWFACYRKVK